MPDEYDELRKYTDMLPLSDPAPAPPFAGLVYNLNVATELHRDPNDDLICVVLVVSDCEGGELILVEPGLVIELKNGDAIVFKSSDVTHLNAHFKGLRASIVFHSDKQGRVWVKSFNKWDKSSSFRGTELFV